MFHCPFGTHMMYLTGYDHVLAFKKGGQRFWQIGYLA
jgi:hypothetical protein